VNAGTALAGAGGVLLVGATLVDAFEVMLLPRRVRRRLRFVHVYFRVTWRAWAFASRAMRAGTRGTFLSLYGPLSMLGLFTTWTVALVTGFGVIHWELARGATPGAPSLLTQLYFSGVTFFTLGYGDVTAHTHAGRVLSVVEAGLGFGLIAVVIGYLPVLYQLFSRRESYVIRLDARAGSPPTAAELIARHAVSTQGLESLGVLLNEWEHWAAELLESHLSYPMLGYYRSQHDNESWLAALTTVLDACALLTLGLRDEPEETPLVATPDSTGARLAAQLPTFQARMTFATARLAVVEMARALHGGSADTATPDGTASGADDAGGLDAAQLHDTEALPAPTPLPARDHPGLPERLPPRALARLDARLGEVGLAIGGEQGGIAERLAVLRRTYEPFVEALAARLLLPVPRWVAYDDATDNWQQSVGGQDAKRILDAAEAADAAESAAVAGTPAD